MTSTSVLPAPALVEQPTHTSAMRAVLQRLPAPVLGLVGAGVVAYGVTQPWVSTFAGLITQSGWDTRNGNLLFAGSIASGLLALVSAVWANVTVRWLLALVGFTTAAYGGYLLIQLYTVTQTSDSMIFLGRGPGLYVATAGATIVFSTIFLPMPATSRLVSGPDAGTGAAPAAGSGGLLTAVWSLWRYPAALLAVVAGFAHVPVTPEHLNEAPYIGVLFIVLTTVCVVLAAGLLIADSPVVWAALGGTCLLAVIAFVLSRTIGLPQMADDVGNWSETLGVVSVVTESAVVVFSVLALRKSRRKVNA